jgi:serine/threonine protein kinase
MLLSQLSQLGKYRLVAEIARGGMGIVYLAVAHGPARFSKLLVVKELKPELAEDPAFLEMFLEEARLAARLNHPNIVQTYEIGAEGKRHYMVMDYLEGVTLSGTLRKKNEQFTLGMQLRTLCEVLRALTYAHTLTDFDGTPLGIVHRDTTPQNVFITFDGQIKLVDFGIAKALDSTLETRAGVLKGKPGYMAPEQVQGDADMRADVYAVGVMLWEAVVGRRMWHKKGDIEVLSNLIKGLVPSLRETKPDTHEELLRISERALAKNPDERYATAADFLADLEAFLVLTQNGVSARDVGKHVATLFAAERAATKATIEAHIASLKSGKVAEKLPSLRPLSGELMSTPSGQRPGSMRLADPPSFTPSFTPSPGSLGTPGGTELPGPPVGLQAPKKSGTLWVSVASAVVTFGVILAFASGAFRRGTDPDRARVGSAGPSATEPVAALPAVAAPATHEISLRANPPNAVLTIDGVALSNPGKRTCTQGNHVVLNVSAPRFVTTARELRCDQDESIELVLQPEPVALSVPPAVGAPAMGLKRPRPAVAPPTPPPPAVTPRAASEQTLPPARPSEVSPSGGARPNRPIDTASPYGNP